MTNGPCLCASMSEGVCDAEVAEAAKLLRTGRTDLGILSGLHEDEIEAAFTRARRMMRAGLNENAMKVFVALVVLKPREPRFYRNLGVACHRAGKIGQAVLAYTAALGFDPHDTISDLLRAECYVRTRGVDAGKAALRAAMAVAPETPRVRPYYERARNLLLVLERRASMDATTKAKNPRPTGRVCIS